MASKKVTIPESMCLFIGGPFDQEVHSATDSTNRLVIPVMIKGKTVFPPRWCVYRRVDSETFKWVRDGSFDACFDWNQDQGVD